MYSAILCWQAAETATAKPEEPVVMAAAMLGPGATVTRVTEPEALLAVRSVESEVMVGRADPVAAELVVTAVEVRTATLTAEVLAAGGDADCGGGGSTNGG